MPRGAVTPRRQEGQGDVLWECLPWIEETPLHSSAVLPQLQATTTGLAAPSPASSELGGEVMPARESQPGSLWACSCPARLPARPFLLASALAPPFASPASPRPLIPRQPPAASPSGKQPLPPPQTHSLSRQNTGWPPALDSHHRGRCLGRKAEVRKCPAPRRLPFRERRSRSLRQHFRAGPSRAGPGRRRRETVRSPGRFHTGTSGTWRRPAKTRQRSRPLGSPHIFHQRL